MENPSRLMNMNFSLGLERKGEKRTSKTDTVWSSLTRVRDIIGVALRVSLEPVAR